MALWGLSSTYIAMNLQVSLRCEVVRASDLQSLEYNMIDDGPHPVGTGENILYFENENVLFSWILSSVCDISLKLDEKNKIKQMNTIRLGIIKYLAFLYLLLISWIAITYYSTAHTWCCTAAIFVLQDQNVYIYIKKSNFPQLPFLNCFTP